MHKEVIKFEKECKRFTDAEKTVDNAGYRENIFEFYVYGKLLICKDKELNVHLANFKKVLGDHDFDTHMMTQIMKKLDKNEAEFFKSLASK